MQNIDHAKAVDRVQTYIKDNIHKAMTLRELADVAGYSPWYTAKIFKKAIGKSPFEYIRLLRLSKAAMKFRDEDKKIIDVAFDFVFNSHEGFTRAFSKEFGMTPRLYQKEKPPIKLFLPYPTLDYYKYLEKGDSTMDNKLNTSTVFTQVVEKTKRKLILKRAFTAKDYFKYCEEVGCDIWGVLTSIDDALGEPMDMWLPKKLIEKGSSEYVQGVEVAMDYDGIVPNGFDIIELDACKVMIFQGEKYDDDNFMEEISKLKKSISKYDPTIYGFEWADDDAPRFQLEPQGSRGYIEGRPVRSIK